VEKRKKEQEREEKKRNEQRLLRQKKAEKEFEKLKSKFFDLNLSDGKIVIVVLKTLEDFKEEGDAMKHCVFTNEYFKKKDSLILSARIGDKRIETIELNLKTLQVVQSRGVCNQNTEYHDRIISLVNKNINLIRRKLTA
ncbi:PcfJ domain-containing protein, partial [Bacteroides sp.]